MLSFLRKRTPAEVLASAVLFSAWQNDDSEMVVRLTQSVQVSPARVHQEIIALRTFACAMGIREALAAKLAARDKLLAAFYALSTLYCEADARVANPDVAAQLTDASKFLRHAEHRFADHYPHEFAKITANRQNAPPAALVRERFQVYGEIVGLRAPDRDRCFRQVCSTFVGQFGITDPLLVLRAFATFSSQFAEIRDLVSTTRT